MAKKGLMRGYQEGGLGSGVGREAFDSLTTARRERPDYITDSDSIAAYDELDRKLIANDMAKLAIFLRDDFDLASTPMGQRVLASLRPRSIADIKRLIAAQNVVSRGVFTEGTPDPGEGLMVGEPQQARRATNWSARALEEAKARGESLGNTRGSREVYTSSDRNIDGAYENSGKPTVDVEAASTRGIPANLEGVTAEEYEAAKSFVDNHPLAGASPEGLQRLMVTIGEGQERASRKDRFGFLPSVAMQEGGLMRRAERLPNLDQIARDAIIKQAQREYNQPLEDASDEEVLAASRAMTDFVPGLGDVLGIKDAYDTVTDSNASTMAKAAAVGLASLGLVPLVGDAVAAPFRAAARQADALRIQDNIADTTTDAYARAKQDLDYPSAEAREQLQYAADVSGANTPSGFFLDPANYPLSEPRAAASTTPSVTAPKVNPFRRRPATEDTGLMRDPAPSRASRSGVDADQLESLTDEWSRGNLSDAEYRTAARRLGVIIPSKSLAAGANVEDIIFDLPDGRRVRGLGNL